MDFCTDNNSPQVCFIDDGLVVPGTRGTTCVDYCYGPGGYIVNNTGGLSGLPIKNNIVSPVMSWPSDYESGIIEFDVYVHERLEEDSPSVVYYWGVRSTSSQEPSDINSDYWHNDVRSYFGGPEYRRHAEDISQEAFAAVYCSY